MKPQLKAEGHFNDGKHSADFSNIPVFIIKEGKTSIYYSPVFDLSGYGHSEKEAQKSLMIAIDEFFKYTMNKKTLETELIKLGWKHPKKKKFVPPAMSDMVKKRDYLSEIINEHNFRKESLNLNPSTPAVA
ncbi:MAG: hypothetical protein ABJP45_03645 [Cyclobacteriaceae bacterium]